LAASLTGLAVWKWRLLQDRHTIISVIGRALKDRKALLAGIAFAVLYLALFMILGGKGGRIHLLFGRWIFNTTPGDLLAGLALAILLMISMALFFYGLRVTNSRQSGKKAGMSFWGVLLALAAAFCP
jgi:hypothetical protein